MYNVRLTHSLRYFDFVELTLIILRPIVSHIIYYSFEIQMGYRCL